MYSVWNSYFLKHKKNILPILSFHKCGYYIFFEHIYSLPPSYHLTTINDPPNDVFLAHSILFNLIYVRKGIAVRL